MYLKENVRFRNEDVVVELEVKEDYLLEGVLKDGFVKILEKNELGKRSKEVLKKGTNRYMFIKSKTEANENVLKNIIRYGTIKNRHEMLEKRVKKFTEKCCTGNGKIFDYFTGELN